MCGAFFRCQRTGSGCYYSDVDLVVLHKNPVFFSSGKQKHSCWKLRPFHVSFFCFVFASILTSHFVALNVVPAACVVWCFVVVVVVVVALCCCCCCFAQVFFLPFLFCHVPAARGHPFGVCVCTGDNYTAAVIAAIVCHFMLSFVAASSFIGYILFQGTLRAVVLLVCGNHGRDFVDAICFSCSRH